MLTSPNCWLASIAVPRSNKWTAIHIIQASANVNRCWLTLGEIPGARGECDELVRVNVMLKAMERTLIPWQRPNPRARQMTSS